MFKYNKNSKFRHEKFRIKKVDARYVHQSLETSRTEHTIQQWTNILKNTIHRDWSQALP